jgi:hypothetical protein
MLCCAVLGWKVPLSNTLSRVQLAGRDRTALPVSSVGNRLIVTPPVSLNVLVKGNSNPLVPHPQAVAMLRRALQVLDGPSPAAAQDRPQPQGQGAGAPGTRPPSPAAPSSSWLALGPRHIMRLRLCEQLLKAAIDWGSSGATAVTAAGTAADPWAIALQAARQLEPQYLLCYPHSAGWPNLSLHYATMAKLEMLLGRPRRALRAARRALEGLSLTHGSCGRGGSGVSGVGVLEQVQRTALEAEMELQASAHAGGSPDEGLEAEAEELDAMEV